MKKLVPLILLAACAGNKAPQQVVPAQTVMTVDSVKWNGDAELAPVLIHPELTEPILDAVAVLDQKIGHDEFIDRLGAIAEDTANPWLVRVNALRILPQRNAIVELPLYASLLHDKDERIRIADVTAMKTFLQLREQPAVEILTYALNDPSPAVITAALQMFGDRDPAPLRALVARTKDTNIKQIATDLIHAAEERGASLAEKDTAGTLERVSGSGPALTYKPSERWKNWDASVGDLYVTPAKSKKAVLVASGVEVVNNVVPAFFTSDGNTLVYELKREIHSRNLLTAHDTVIAKGIAPRILPFTNDIVYLSELPNKRTMTPNSVSLHYDLMRMPAIGGTATRLGDISARALNDENGNYSTARWARVLEENGTFVLSGEGIEPFRLPSPFGQ